MGNNIFMTGRMNTGKTYTIKRILAKLDLAPGGFMVGRDRGQLGWSSFYLLPVNIFLEDDREKVNKLKEKGTFAWKDKNQNIKLDSEVFDNYGVELLKKGRKKDIIIMDELGRFEIKAHDFQNKVIELLKSDKLVLGVIKLEKNKFLDKVRGLLEKDPIVVTEDNRGYIYKDILKSIKKMED